MASSQSEPARKLCGSTFSIETQSTAPASASELYYYAHMRVSKKSSPSKAVLRFEAVKIEPLFTMLDAVAWLDHPSAKHIAQFADVDPRTAGKVLKNARLIGLIDSPDDMNYVLSVPYPYKGTSEEKTRVVREALLRLPLVRSIRQFLALGDGLQDAMRKAATIAGETAYDRLAVAPLIGWADSVGEVFNLSVRVETLVEAAVASKEVRHSEHAGDRVAFISHSSRDKPFVRKLASDLVANGIKVWLDEQQILAGDSLPEKIAQGLAGSDFFLLVVSAASIASPWVRKELSHALVAEIEQKKVVVIPLRIDDAALPNTVTEKVYADFRGSYEIGLDSLLLSVKMKISEHE